MAEFLLQIVISVILLLLGIYLILFYDQLKRRKKTGAFSFKLQSAGIGLIIIAIGIIIRAALKYN